MDIFTGQGHKSGTLIRVIKVIVLYLILINSSNYSARKNHNLNSNCNQLPQENMNIHCSLINNLDEKVLLDLSKNDLLSLLNKDSIISISIDLEGKIIEVLKRIEGPIIINAAQNYPKHLIISDPNFPASTDPHVWFDVDLSKIAISTITEPIEQSTLSSSSYEITSS